MFILYTILCTVRYVGKFGECCFIRTYIVGERLIISKYLYLIILVNTVLLPLLYYRYSGGLVPDVYHILVKGQGVLSNASSRQAKAKLRLLFEAAPIALIIEAAGGATCVCPTEVFELVGTIIKICWLLM